MRDSIATINHKFIHYVDPRFQTLMESLAPSCSASMLEAFRGVHVAIVESLQSAGCPCPPRDASLLVQMAVASSGVTILTTVMGAEGGVPSPQCLMFRGLMGVYASWSSVRDAPVQTKRRASDALVVIRRKIDQIRQDSFIEVGV